MTARGGGVFAARRGWVILLLGATLALAGLSARCRFSAAAAGTDRRVIVLGMDGLDPELIGRLMKEGKLPNFSRLAAMGRFQPLGTAIPPQSPVAWSTFITGLDPGGHGIYDFIHRDPKTMFPYLSTSKAEPSGRPLKLGKYCLPLKGGETVLLRHGTPFWELLEDRGVETTVMRMPANYPPSGKAHQELSGMGTPDILGTYGMFSFYTSDPQPFANVDVSGGTVYPVTPRAGVIAADLHGPANELLCDPKKLTTPFTIYLDPDEPAAKIVVGGQERLLRQGEWTDWIPVDFHLMPTQSLRAMGRFYLKNVRPTFEMYVTPLNIDPLKPAQPISTPTDFATDLAETDGRFYTQGMPADTKALSNGVFTPGEFLTQARFAGEEVIRQYDDVLGHFQKGLLFYYFSDSDQVSHMMWRAMDPSHPAYKAERDAPYANAIPEVYERLDEVVGMTMQRMPPDTLLIVMSDHGFTSWRRSFSLNTWLKDNGYLVESEGEKRGPLFANVDWTRTRAYGLGINGLYINLWKREKYGVVEPSEREALMKEIASKLLATIDPQTGRPAITKAYLREEVYKDGSFPDIAPDIVVGYAKGVRGSNKSALGEVTGEVLTDNTEEWSGDHCMDHETVPGVLFVSRPLKKPASSLKDLAASILAEFGVEGFPVRK